MVVFDDESDDASILDAEKSKTVPYAITRLWAGTKQSANFDRTHSTLLYATYLAYTATPQANMLQIESNPLSPTDFIFTLKTPFIEESSLTFRSLMDCLGAILEVKYSTKQIMILTHTKQTSYKIYLSTRTMLLICQNQ